VVFVVSGQHLAPTAQRNLKRQSSNSQMKPGMVVVVAAAEVAPAVVELVPAAAAAAAVVVAVAAAVVAVAPAVAWVAGDSLERLSLLLPLSVQGLSSACCSGETKLM
jgi:hypothetical protein